MSAKKPAEKKSSPAKDATTMKRAHGQAGSKEFTTARRMLFAEAYIANGGKAGEAAIEIGVGKGNAASWASHALKHPLVVERIKASRERQAKKFRLESESVLSQLASIVYFDPREMVDDAGNLLPIKQWPDHVAAAVASMDVEEVSVDGAVMSRVKKVKILDKNSAIEKAMRHLGQFAEDNKQKKGMLENVPPEVLKLIRDRLEAMSADASVGRK